MNRISGCMVHIWTCAISEAYRKVLWFLGDNFDGNVGVWIFDHTRVLGGLLDCALPYSRIGTAPCDMPEN